MEAKRYRRAEDPTHPNPSIVVHVRNLGPLVTEADLVDSLSQIGPVAYTTCMPNKGMALVEFETLEDARRCVSMSQTTPIDVAGAPALFNYSTSQTIQRTNMESERPNRILCLTITQCKHPVNVRITNPIGAVKRISIIRSNVIQALVEFEDKDICKVAKMMLNGAEIYPDSNIIKAEFARAESVKIVRQDFEQWDYTICEAGPDPNFRPVDTTTAPIPQTAVVDPVAYNNQQLAQAQQQALKDMGRPVEGFSDYYEYDRPQRASRFAPVDDYAAADGRRHPPPETAVLMVYGVNHEQFDCERIFNLFCCYGNVVRVKFMHSKTDTCMVQMGTAQEASNVLKYLQGANAFRTTLAIRPSKQSVLRDLAGEPFQLQDGQPSFADYSQSRHQRFSVPALASRNRIVYPTAQLHFFCAPLDITEDFVISVSPNSTVRTFFQIFRRKPGPQPISAMIFNTRSERFSSGLVTFDNPETATEAMMIYNHMNVDDINGDPFVLKLAFAGSRDREYRAGY